MGAINAVAAQAGDRLRFRVVHDEGFFQALETPHKSFTPLCEHLTSIWTCSVHRKFLTHAAG